MFPHVPYLYEFFLCLGLFSALGVFTYVAKKQKMSKQAYNFYFNLILVSMGIGLLSAIFFQWIYNIFEYGWSAAGEDPGMTFLGGLAGGLATGYIGTRLVAKPEVRAESGILLKSIAPGVALAHCFGRIGCFCAGCCFGMEHDGFFSMTFPADSEPAHHISGGEHSVSIIPTMLYEAIFLFVLFWVTLYFTRHSVVIYLLSYGVWRFLIEFVRADDRGQIFWQDVLSPSQFLSLVMIAIGLFLLYRTLRRRRAPPPPA